MAKIKYFTVYTTGAPLVVWAGSEREAKEQINKLGIPGIRALSALEGVQS